jgi:hypothetical protein
MLKDIIPFQGNEICRMFLVITMSFLKREEGITLLLDEVYRYNGFSILYIILFAKKSI